MPIPFVMETGLALGGAGLNYLGQREANETNERIAERAGARNQASAREQMQFEERMSNTAVQRRAADMKAAGINPLLAGTSEASTPGGASAQNPTATVESETKAAVSSALEAKALMANIRKQNEEMKLLNAQTRKTNTDEEVARKGIPEADLKNKIYDRARPLLNKILDSTDTNAKKKSWQQQYQETKRNIQLGRP